MSNWMSATTARDVKVVNLRAHNCSLTLCFTFGFSGANPHFDSYSVAAP